MTLKERIVGFFAPIVEPYITEPLDMIDDFLREEEKKVLFAVPKNKLIPFSSTTKFSSDEYNFTNDIRILSVMSNGYEATGVTDFGLVKYSDSGSLHYRDSRNPIYAFSGTVLSVSPYTAGVENQFWFVRYGIVSGGNLSYTIEPLEEAIVIGASIKYGMQLIAYITNDTISSVAAPTPPTLLFDSWDFTEVVPEFSPVVMLGDDITSFTNAKTFIKTDEELEIAESELGLQRVRLENYQVKLKETMDKFTGKITTYKTELETYMAKLKEPKEEDIIKIQKYSSQVSAYAAAVNESVNKKQITIEGYMKVLQLLTEKYKESLMIIESLL